MPDDRQPRLSTSSLGNRNPGTKGFSYDRGTITPGIVHLGIGAFHRAHQAVYLDDLLARFPQWGIIGASLRRPDTLEALGPQDCLYTVLVRDGSGEEARIVGSILDIIDATAEGERLLATMANPEIRIVSLTVTEKGYCHDPATGRLDLSHPDIVHDLKNPSTPRSAPGFLVEALARRKQAGHNPFAIMSCDNLPRNGHTARAIVLALAAERDESLARWIEEQAGFPSTMVDRIVPASTDADKVAVAAVTGLRDEWPVVTEPFTQWVIEDNFPHGRPAFEEAGAELVADVTEFEHMKLRMLNGSHSTIAYLGYLAGDAFVSDVVARPEFFRLIHGLMTEEVMPTLDMPGTDLGAYRDRLLERFSNPALKHRTWQIAMDGSQKLPQRLLGTIRDRLAKGRAIMRLSLGVAAWMRYVGGIDDKGERIDVRDPLAGRLAALSAEHADAGGKVGALLGVSEVFGDDLAANSAFRDLLVAHLESLEHDGAARTVEALG